MVYVVNTGVLAGSASEVAVVFIAYNSVPVFNQFRFREKFFTATANCHCLIVPRMWEGFRSTVRRAYATTILDLPEPLAGILHFHLPCSGKFKDQGGEGVAVLEYTKGKKR